MNNIGIGKIFIGGAANQSFNGDTEFNAVNYVQATGSIIADLSAGIVTREFTPSIENSFKILPVGDSITYGFTNTEIENKPKNNDSGGYRNFLNQFLINDNLGEAVDFVGSQKTGAFEDNEHEGHSGKRISFISDNIAGWLNVQQPDMLLLMIGTNDTKSDTNPSTADDRLSALLDKITNQSPKTHLLVASIPPIDPSVRKIQSDNAKAYNATIPGIIEDKLAAGKKVTFVDVNKALTVSDIFDGVHPSLQGYEKIANSWYDWIKSSQDTLININNIIGTAYSDRLTGNANSNIIQGGAGDDLIIGGGGDDLLSGGTGKDTFVLTLGEGTDTITDFLVGEDSLALSGGLTFEQLSITQGTGNYINDTWITSNNSGEQLALLLGVQAATINGVNNSSESLVTINGIPVSNPVESYGGSMQDVTGDVTVSPSNQLNLSGNRWKRVNINTTIAPDTILRFNFKGNGKGEVQGIGFDNNNNISGADDSGHFFQVAGSQSWGIENLGQYIVGSSDGFNQYSIPVGQLFTGRFNFLTIGND
ncbi:MAG: GDSL-type esterase/lipase family protein, partial [Rivularia sp. (in: cyanobacteria)]